jgi:hypothetical protein
MIDVSWATGQSCDPPAPSHINEELAISELHFQKTVAKCISTVEIQRSLSGEGQSFRANSVTTFARAWTAASLQLLELGPAFIMQL